MAAARVDLESRVAICGPPARIALEAGDPRGLVAHRSMVGVADEVVGRVLPVALHLPLVRGADEFDAALASIEHHVEIPGHVAEILGERWRSRVERGENQAAVAVQLGYRHEAMRGEVELAVVHLLESRNVVERAIAP